ncbi:hypothetical protein PFFCH_00169 [Plasmodium falciparum FCH/4]|uniref:Uncharacterized protein n=1 Tax=Plasmodium falciparum FCH/4 TaxID=1036724 RepID=A0A024VVS5_PLAFA|nr:hypothetical protein PFFCH_00169 [Plasmodium falciparum FCH/4]
MDVEVHDDQYITTFFYDNCFSHIDIKTYCNDHTPMNSYQDRNIIKETRNKCYERRKKSVIDDLNFLRYNILTVAGGAENVYILNVLK